MGLGHKNLGHSSTKTPFNLIIIGGMRLCSISAMYKALLMIKIVVAPVIGQSYATAAWTTGTSGIIPKSSEKGVTLTVISVLYKIIAFSRTTGESACESSSVLDWEEEEDDAAIFITELMCLANVVDIVLASPASIFPSSSSFQMRLPVLWLRRWSAGLLVLVITGAIILEFCVPCVAPAGGWTCTAISSSCWSLVSKDETF